MASAARRQIIGGGGGGAPIIKSRRRRPQIDGGDKARRANAKYNAVAMNCYKRPRRSLSSVPSRDLVLVD